MSIEPSVEPVSETITSPRTPARANADNALSMHASIERASLRHGMTTETVGEDSVMRRENRRGAIRAATATRHTIERYGVLLGRATPATWAAEISRSEERRVGKE